MELNSSKEISWVTAISESGLETKTVFFGHGPQPMQVAYGVSEQKPSRGLLKRLHAERKGNLPISLIVAVEHGNQVSMFGPEPDTDVLTESLGRSEAILNSVIGQQSEILAYQRAMSIWRSKQTTEILGFTNTGLFASHYIRSSIGKHPDWKSAEQKSQQIVNLREKELLERLGFRIQSTPSSTLLLGAGDDANRVVAILLEQNEQFDSKSNRLQASPVEWSLAIASEHGAPWVVAIKDSQIRLYPAKEGVGVGQKSQAETYFEIDLMMVDEQNLGLLDLIFSAQSLAEGGTVEQLLADSKKFAAELGVRLRERVYESVVPNLAKEIANQLRKQGHELDAKGLQNAYEITLRVLFRLLFQAYAEDRGLLPAGRNEIFDSNSMKRWSEHLLDRDPDSTFGDASSIWFDLMQIWDAIDQGNPDMQIPPYNGGLFGTDPELHPTGHLIRQLSIPDRVMGPALRALVVDDNTEDGVPGAVDFRSLSVREFGTIYEGLLESSLSVADQDLTVDKKGAWVPAEGNQDVLASKGEVYFHSASGERKSTGSYYTPAFIVDYLIEKSVEPTLETHLAKVKEKLEEGDQAAAYKLFFDFRVADLAMGSGHFLVAAIDKIETVMRSFLTKPGNEIDGVNGELLRLESAAKEALGKDEAAYAEIERASLLRRQIARRCIYGLDINPLAVELSRLAIWIHTFVPGLPMSSLEHNLVCANSLTGIGSVEEGLNALIPDREKHGTSLFDAVVENSLAESKKLLEDLAEADEANKKEAKRAADIARQARAAANKSKMIFDLAVANRNGVISTGAAMTEDELTHLHESEEVRNWVDNINPAHMPLLFPEVFFRNNPGFDVMVGNPPWKEAMVEAPKFWMRHSSGILGLTPAARDAEIKKLEIQRPDAKREFELEKANMVTLRRAILSNPFPDLGKGDIDLYSIFAWKYLSCISHSGFIGLVLPRSILSTAGSARWRSAVLNRGEIELVQLKNTGGWVFESVGQQYSICLMVSKPSSQKSISLTGMIASVTDWVQKAGSLVPLSDDWVKDVDSGLGIPNISTGRELDALIEISTLPTTEELGLRPVGEFHATNDRKFFDSGQLSPSPGYSPVIGGKGFDLWKPLTGKFYAIAEDKIAKQALLTRLARQNRLERSAFYKFTRSELPLESDLPLSKPRIAFRDIARGSDIKTAIFGLVPAGIFLTNKAPYVLMRGESRASIGFYLGLFSSSVFDWQAKKYVELGFSFFALSRMRLPKFDETNQNHMAISQLAWDIATRNGKVDYWQSGVANLDDFVNLEPPSKKLITELETLVLEAFGLNDFSSEVFFRNELEAQHE